MKTGVTTTAGPILNNQASPLAGTMSSFNRSLIPSARDWIIPNGPAYSGPIRCWTPADTFHSSHTMTNTPVVTPITKIIIDTRIQIKSKESFATTN